MEENPDQIDLSDVMSLSVIELYILNYLIRVAGSVIRFTVFNEINNQLTKNSLSRSSFYNSLETLEEAGFIEVDEAKGARKKSIQATPKAKKAIDQVNIFNIWGSVDPDTKFRQWIENHQSELFSGSSGESQLIISLQYPANLAIIELLSKGMGGIKLLGSEEVIGPIAENFELVSTDEKGIVERNEIFSQVVLYRYAYNEIQFPFGFDLLISESLRVLKPGGQLICMAIENLQATNNLLLESGIGTILQETLENQSTEYLLDGLSELQSEGVVKSIDKETVDGLHFIVAMKS